jgi:hypothetical protein
MATTLMWMPATHLPLSYYRLFTQSPKSVLSSMPWLLDPRLKQLLPDPPPIASTCRPLQPLPLHHNPDPPDLGPCPTPPTPTLTLLAPVAQSRRPYLCTFASAPYRLTPSPLQQWLLCHWTHYGHMLETQRMWFLLKTNMGPKWFTNVSSIHIVNFLVNQSFYVSDGHMGKPPKVRFFMCSPYNPHMVIENIQVTFYLEPPCDYNLFPVHIVKI